jgi:hypothetical protein
LPPKTGRTEPEDRKITITFDFFLLRGMVAISTRWPIDFTFKTDPLESSKSDFAVMGTEVNGKYYETTKRLKGKERIAARYESKTPPQFRPLTSMKCQEPAKDLPPAGVR